MGLCAGANGDSTPELQGENTPISLKAIWVEAPPDYISAGRWGLDLSQPR